MGSDVQLGLWEKILIRCMDGSVLCTLGIKETRELRIPQILMNRRRARRASDPHFYNCYFHKRDCFSCISNSRQQDP